MHLLARHVGLIEAIDRRLHLLKVHKPYHESDHVLNIAYTDFSQIQHLDRWDEDGVGFLFGIDAMANLVQEAESLPSKAWKRLVRPAKYEVATQQRARPDHIKEQIVRQREYQNIGLVDEEVAEFAYRPTACRKDYRVVVVRKNLSVAKGEQVLFDDVRYFFYITNERTSPADAIVLLANDRCNQENLIAQLKGGVRALAAPVDSLESNWAYMVMASLAWTLKAWMGLLLPERLSGPAPHGPAKAALLKMEFKRLVNAFMLVPCQIVRRGPRVVYRLLAWNPWQGVFLRAVEALRHPLRC